LVQGLFGLLCMRLCGRGLLGYRGQAEKQAAEEGNGENA
jgi:hypothetical protein